ncbi:hypothetical protein SAMN06264364_11332 [Quadrisphaera granulorum]|uniref:Uncharacterized protein n=1 Tax=Quadrisphaera granulorum TaxID=317664 RepID=A0A316A8U8_9ACTN|nr:hypothetical protein [Quadrisphaera granulorum]PWJ53274.1 hypothetical protein BXY45_11332 [Quadrisphaera granulorum]SZE96948.1 hypothetical protein SAMN06264364_11332 [Quadrisphaera granulorum]
MSTTHAETRRPGPPGRGAIRKPILSPASVALFLLFLGGAVLATIVPAGIAPPEDLAGSTLTEAWQAFGVSVVGLLIMAIASGFLYARTKEIAMLVLAIAPTTAGFVGAVVLLAMHGFAAAYPDAY